MKFSLLLLATSLLFGQQTPVPQDKDKASLEGVVVNAVTGEPLRKARLTLRMNAALPQLDGQRRPSVPAPQSQATTVVSDAVGKFEFVNVEPGNYQLVARRDGFQDKEYGARSTGRIEDLILLTAGDRKTNFQVKLTPYGAIAGRLVDEDGDPVQNLRVATMSYRYNNTGRELVEVRTATSDDLGQFRIFDVAPGKYFLKASPAQMRLNRESEASESFAPMFFPGAADTAAATMMEVAPGQQLSGITLQMRRVHYATIRGRVIAPPGATMSIGLMVVSDGGSSSSSTSTSIDEKDGKFELYGVGPGEIYLTGDYTMNGQRYSAQLPLQVGSSDINGVELRPAAAMDVSGQVRIDGTTTIKPSQLLVTLQGPGRGYGYETGTVREDGRMLLRGVQPNVYRVNVTGLRDLYLKSVHWGAADITDVPLDLTGGVPARTELSVVVGADSAEISGVVKNDNGDPMDSATVTLVPTGSHAYSFHFKSASTNSAGKFTIRGVSPGSYRILAWDKVEPNAVRFDPDFLRPYDGAGQNLQAQPGDKQNLELKRTINKAP